VSESVQDGDLERLGADESDRDGVPLDRDSDSESLQVGVSLLECVSRRVPLFGIVEDGEATMVAVKVGTNEGDSGSEGLWVALTLSESLAE
jgi:hypothetical protein